MNNSITNKSLGIIDHDHPLFSGRYMLKTQRIKQLEKHMLALIKMRATGGLIIGKQRYGKTRARLHMKVFIEKELPGLRVIEIPCRHEPKGTEKSFFMHILDCSGHALITQRRDTTNLLRNRLNEYLKMVAEEFHFRWVVIFLDDAQRLNEDQYGWLMDIHNEMQQVGIHLGFYLFGQPELRHQKSAFKKTERHQLVARFMLNEFEFSGLKSPTEVASCLAGYDETKHPPGSGISFTSHFFHEAFSSGWRARNLANLIWDAFVELRQTKGVKGPCEIPMEFFTRTVEVIFKTYANHPVHIDPIDYQGITESIRLTRYVDYIDGMGTENYPTKDA